MTQPILLQAFASTPVRTAALQRASSAGPCASCGQSGCDCSGGAEQARAAQPVDELELSEEALAAAEQASVVQPQPPDKTGETDAVKSVEKDDAKATAKSDDEQGRPIRGERPPEAEEAGETGTELTEEEQQQVAELKSRDREVRAHEQAHLTAAGPYAQGGPSYDYEEGPDGRSYAVGGEVSIDTSPVSGDPEATIEKAQQVRAAALAPASPSSQDQRVAAAATQIEAQARLELAQQNRIQQNAAASYGSVNEKNLAGMLLDLVA